MARLDADFHLSVRKRRRNHALLWQSCFLAMPFLHTLAFVAERRYRPWSYSTSKCNCSPVSQLNLFHSRPTIASKLFVSTEMEETAQTEVTTAAPILSEHVWIWEDNANESSGRWKPPSSNSSTIDKSEAEKVTTLVSNWCEDFVLALDLCPWARASLQTKGAMRFFLVPPAFENVPENDLYEHQRQRMGKIVDTVAERFQTEILSMDGDEENPEALMLEKAAIYFVVFLPNKDKDATETALVLPDSFFDFIDWFTELEEDWPEEFDNVIVAPFHPTWEFETVDDGTENNLEACLDYEKRSPYPLVTLVSTSVVEKAGEAVTESIGEHNRQVLMEIETKQQKQKQKQKQGLSNGKNKKSHLNASVGELWWSAVYGDTVKKAKQ